MQRFLQDVIAPIQNKVGQLLMAPPIRNIFGQVKSKIDPRFYAPTTSTLLISVLLSLVIALVRHFWH